MDVHTPDLTAQALVAFVQDRLAKLRDKPDFDWQPIVQPPQAAYERRLKPCPAPEWSPPAGSIDEARQIIRDAIRDYLSDPFPTEILLVKALPGTGKTTAAVAVVDEIAASGRRVAYAGPRHDLYQDVIAKSETPVEWYEWLPRQAEDPDTGKIQTCNYAGQMAEWLNKGYPAMDFCSGVCGWDYVNKNCIYHAQKKRPERAIYIQHQHVTLGHPLKFHVLFGDENPLAAFTHEWRIPARWILPPGMDPTEPLTEVLNWMTILAQSTQRAVMGPELMEVLGGPETVLAACECFEIPLSAIAYGSIHRPEEVETTPYFHLPHLVDLLAREARQAAAGVDYPHRIIVSPGSLTLLLRRQPDDLPPHVVWLDATGRPEIYQKIFRRPVKVIDARPRMHGRIYQVVDRANGKSTITGDGDELPLKAQQLESLVKKIIQNHGYERPSIISFKDFVEKSELRKLAKIGHFYAARGTNEHEDADAIFILGAPQSNIYDVVKLAKMIYFERDTAFRVEWSTREAVYNYVAPDGLGRSYPVSGFWNDPDLQAVLEMIREDEIIQAAHRGRPVNKPVDIWLLTNIPIPSLPPDALLTMREVMGAPEGVDIFKWERLQQIADEAGQVFMSDLKKLGLSENTAKKYLKILEEMGWERGARRPSGRGRPETGVIKPQ